MILVPDVFHDAIPLTRGFFRCRIAFRFIQVLPYVSNRRYAPERV
jgi:hypothetical protein